MNENDIENIAHLDLYEILDISKLCSDKKIKKAYKNLVLRLHPDKNPGETDSFELVNFAYTILKNENLKKSYNKKRKEYLNSNNFDSLKYNKIDNLDYFPKNEKEAISKFKILENELNKKHNYNNSETDPIGNSELIKKLQNLKFSRNNFDQEYKTIVQKKHINKEDFNDMFIDSSDKTINTELIIKDNDNLSITQYAPINEFNLYSENTISTNSSSSLDTSFTNNLPINVSNNYSNHNYISSEDTQNNINKMNEYSNNLTSNYFS